MEGFAHLLVSEGGGNAHSEKTASSKSVLLLRASHILSSLYPTRNPQHSQESYPNFSTRRILEPGGFLFLCFAILGFRGLASVFLFSWGLAAVFLVFDLRVRVTSGGGLLRVGVGYFGERFRAPRGGLLRGGLLQGYFQDRLRWVTSARLQMQSQLRTKIEVFSQEVVVGSNSGKII